MAGWGDAVGAVLGWFSPEQRMKAKRIKRDALKAEREKLLKGACTVATTKRVADIDDQLTIIERDLGN